MTNEEILQKLEEEIYLHGFSPHTQEEYMIRALCRSPTRRTYGTIN